MQVTDPGQPWQVRQTILEVYLAKLRHNFARLRKDAGRAEILVVLKSDAYGHGHCAVATSLEKMGKNSGLFGFGVANVEEGIELRRRKLQLPILVMSGIQHFDEEMYRCLQTCSLTPVVSSLRVLQEIDAFSRSNDVSVLFHIKFNTGMNRLGIDAKDLAVVIKILKANPRLQVEGLMSHYAAADKPNNALTKRQSKIFSNIVEELRKQQIPFSKLHMENSSGLSNKCFPDGDIVRIGLHLYGVGNKFVQPISRWTAQVYQVRELSKGDAIGYGSLFVSKKKMRTAILGVGYADGYRRAFSNRAEVLINGKRCKVLGAVSMDLTAVDITGVSGVNEFSRAVLLGKDGKDEITVEELASHAKCIPWEILTGISPRVPRKYIYE